MKYTGLFFFFFFLSLLLSTTLKTANEISFPTKLYRPVLLFFDLPAIFTTDQREEVIKTTDQREEVVKD